MSLRYAKNKHLFLFTLLAAVKASNILFIAYMIKDMLNVASSGSTDYWHLIRLASITCVGQLLFMSSNFVYETIKMTIIREVNLCFKSANLTYLIDQGESSNDYNNERYQADVHILNINFVDRKQPSKLYHLKDIGGTAVYHVFQGDNEFVITGKLKDWHFRDQLKHIKVPTLLTFGQYDTMPLATAKIMQHKIPNAQLVVTPDGGHHHMVDNPAVYYRHLADFIKQVEAGTFKGAKD